MARMDDGSQEWFEHLMRNRIKGGRDAYSQYNKVNERLLLQEIDIEKVTDPELKRRLLLAKEAGLAAKERYVKAPHFGPAHLGGKPVDRITASNYAMNVDMDSFSAGLQARHMQFKSQVNEADSAEEQLMRLPPHLRQQAMAKLNMLANGQRAYNATMLNEVGNTTTNNPAFGQQQSQPQQAVTSCRLIDGHPCFRAIETGPWPGLENNLKLARAVGQIVPQVSMHEFVVRGVVSVFVVPPQQTTINTHVIQNNPQLRVELVEVMAPPASGLGVLLVPKEALGLRGGMGNQRGIITDAKTSALRQGVQPQLLLNNRQQQPHPQPTHRIVGGSPPGRGILKG